MSKVQIRARLSEAEYDIIKKFRQGDKTFGDTSFKQTGDNAEYSFGTSERIKSLEDLISACDIDLSVWDIERWICNKWEVGAKDASKEIKIHPLYQVKVWLKPKGAKGFKEVYETLITDMQKFAPKYPVIKRKKNNDGHLLIVDPADPHFGKRATVSETGEETNLITTVKRFAEGIDGLIQKTSYYKYDKIVYVGGNDALHTDNAFGTTTAGTKQDVAGLWHENFLAAKKANIEAIDRLLTIADVHFVFCPSNHDFLTGFFLADTLKSWYSKNKNITFDVDPIHRKYIQYGYSLAGFSHGDGAKESSLSDLMKTEAKKAWSLSKYAYWYVHHVHHKDTKAYMNGAKVNLEKDYRGLTVINTGLALTPEDYCFVEYLRSMSGTDRWHFTKSFVHAFQAMEAFVHHPRYGQIDRMTHLF